MVTELVSYRGTLVREVHKSNMLYIVVAWLVSIAGAVVSLRQFANVYSNDVA